jgi:GDPmannose 4,6-dehydratase
LNALIFGINGQDGHYLKQICEANNIRVSGVSRSFGNWVQGSVADKEFVYNLVKVNKPDYIFHLAANSTTQHDALFENHDSISTGTINILESVYRCSNKTKVFLCGSAMQFKNIGLPINENSPWDPSSPYSVSRIHSVYAARYYRKLGLDVFVGYLFNHDSPLRSERHINKKIVQTVHRIASGSKEKLHIGDLDVKKEFTFAGDVAKAIFILVNNTSNVDECVIGSGKAYSIQFWIELCFKHYNLDWREFVVPNTNFVSQYDTLISDPKLLHSLGWLQSVEIEELSDLMMSHKIQ